MDGCRWIVDGRRRDDDPGNGVGQDFARNDERPEEREPGQADQSTSRPMSAGIGGGRHASDEQDDNKRHRQNSAHGYPHTGVYQLGTRTRFPANGRYHAQMEVAGRAPPRFLPTSRADLDARGWDQLDIIIVSGDAYVDHPAFGPVLIARFLEGRGFKVGVIAQPDWRSAEPFRALGRPRLFFGVSAGNLDSMLNRLTAQKKSRSEDQYSPGGRTGCRPDRATVVYAQRCREAYPDVPIVLGGIEASLRRIAHYDYWSDTVRRSMLLDAKADLLVFGMGERPVWEVADRLSRGERISEIRDVRGTALPINDAEMKRHEADPARMVADRKTVVLPSYEAVVADKRAFALLSRAFQLETNPGNARPLAQRHGQRGVYYNPPAVPLQDGAGR